MPGVIVTGGVDDVWPYINGIDVFLFPLLQGAGLKNKILEAMYAGRPVVTTEIGNEGIDADSRERVRALPDTRGFSAGSDQAVEFPGRKSSHGELGLAFVKKKFSWAPILSAYEQSYPGQCPLTECGELPSGSD